MIIEQATENRHLHFMRDTLPTLINESSLSHMTTFSQKPGILSVDLDDKLVLCFKGSKDECTYKFYVTASSLLNHFMELMPADLE